jgi:hypothetical protein
MKSKLTEAHIQKAVVDFLVLDGWRAIRTDPVSDRSRGKGFGEIGMPDYLFLRYKADCVAQVIWIEFKASGKCATNAQFAWHQVERKRNAAVLVVDSIDVFTRWYSDSGLAQRIRPVVV